MVGKTPKTQPYAKPRSADTYHRDSTASTWVAVTCERTKTVAIKQMQYDRGAWKVFFTKSALTPMKMRPRQLAILMMDTCMLCHLADSTSSKSGLPLEKRACEIEPTLLISNG